MYNKNPWRARWERRGEGRGGGRRRGVGGSHLGGIQPSRRYTAISEVYSHIGGIQPYRRYTAISEVYTTRGAARWYGTRRADGTWSRGAPVARAAPLQDEPNHVLQLARGVWPFIECEATAPATVAVASTEHVEQCGLARARFTHQCYEFPMANVAVELLEDGLPRRGRWQSNHE